MVQNGSSDHLGNLKSASVGGLVVGQQARWPNKNRDLKENLDLQDPKNPPLHCLILQVSANVLFLRGASTSIDCFERFNLPIFGETLLDS